MPCREVLCGRAGVRVHAPAEPDAGPDGSLDADPEPDAALDPSLEPRTEPEPEPEPTPDLASAWAFFAAASNPPGTQPVVSNCGSSGFFKPCSFFR